MLIKNDSKFVRDMSEVLCDKNVLKNRCMQERGQREKMKILIPDKCQLVKGIIYWFLYNYFILLL